MNRLRALHKHPGVKMRMVRNHVMLVKVLLLTILI